MDELKVYTGKETIEALLEGKVLKGKYERQYKITGGVLQYEENGDWYPSSQTINCFLKDDFTEVAAPQAGDWVRVTQGDHTTTGQITSIEDDCFWAKWDSGSKGYYRTYSTGITWEILTPEQVSEYKREQAFVKVGRKPNEFKADDIVYVGALGEVAVVISKENSGEFIKVHLINKTDGFKAKPHQLTPISFVENQVSLD